MNDSVLDGIKGLGKVKKLALFRHFKSYDKIIKASESELMEVEGITQKLASLIKEKLTKE